MLQALLNNVLPVFLMAGSGMAARRLLAIDVKQVARTAMYILSPALAFDSIYRTRIGGGELAKISLFMVLLVLIMVAITALAGRVLGWHRRLTSAAALGAAFPNVANYGLPVILFTWGEAGFERAAVAVVWGAFLMYSAGTFIAARGRQGWRASARAVCKMPLVWAALAASALRLTGLTLPEPIARAVHTLGTGAVPLVVVLLGMQVAGIRLRGARLQIAAATALRLVVAPLVGLGLVALLRPDPLTGKVLILEAAMPAAVNTLLIALELDAEPDLVSGVALVSTVASLLTVSAWVWYLQ